MIEVLNLGAGVQSTCVALMSIKGELPKLDYAIFADTGWEPEAVYRHFNWLVPQLEAVGTNVVVVGNGQLKTDALNSQVRHTKGDGEGRWASLPYFVKNPETGKKGMIRRQCTYEYKIQPIDKFIRREILGLKFRQRAPTEPVVRQWFGISIDEKMRMKTSSTKWSKFYYPLIERRMGRDSCLAWIERNGYPSPPRSACIGCPFHSNHEWRELRDTSPKEWAEAVEFDRAIRKTGGMRGEVYLHSSLLPLDEAPIDPDPNQLNLWDDDCGGYCGL